MSKQFNRKKNDRLSMLQISDLHIHASADWNLMKDAYNQFVGVDFVLVTGDLHEHNKEYTETKEFLNHLKDCLGLTVNDIFMVPGNHDSKNYNKKNVHVNHIKHDIITNPDCYQQLKKDLNKSFTKYNKFIADFYGSTFYVPGEHVSVKTWKDRINILHLNTALISDGNKDHKEIIDAYSLSTLKIKNNLPTIAIAHHSFKDLYELHQEILLRVFTNLQVSSYLCGDLHREEKNNIEMYDIPNSSIPCIVCGKSASKVNDNYSDFGCILYEIDESKKAITVNPYEWNRSKKRFDLSNAFNTDNGAYNFKLKTMSAGKAAKRKETAKPYESFDPQPIIGYRQDQSIWLPDAEYAKGKQTRFQTFTETDILKEFLDKNSNYWGIASVKGIGKTFVLQIKRVKQAKGIIRLPHCVLPSTDNNWATEHLKFESPEQFGKVKSIDKLVSFWKYILIMYVVTQGIPKDKLDQYLEHSSHTKHLTDMTTDLLMERNEYNLNYISKTVLLNSDWNQLAEKDLSRMSIMCINLLHNSDDVAIFIDKIDQALPQGTSELPADCTNCSRVNSCEDCTSPEKSIIFCQNDCASKNCCFGCEIYSSTFSNVNLRIFQESGRIIYSHVNLWQYFQLALVQAVSEIKVEFNGKVKVYYTIRQEAFFCESHIFGENSQKVTSLTVRLWYSKDQHKKIFYDCIRNQENDLLFDSDKKNKEGYEEEAFLGVNKLCHPYVENGVESVFDSIFRHSFDRTRDIQRYGEILTEHLNEIKNIVNITEREEKVKDIIETVAADLAYNSNPAQHVSNISYYSEKNKLLPSYWTDNKKFEELLYSIDRNFLFVDDMARICQKTNNIKECDCSCNRNECSRHPFSMLYKAGFLGQIINNPSNNRPAIQTFLPAHEITYIHEEDCLFIDHNSFYILHPALTKSIEKLRHNRIKHFRGFILGKDIPVSKDVLNNMIADRGKMPFDQFESKYYY